jgi:hypothetical protein
MRELGVDSKPRLAGAAAAALAHGGDNFGIVPNPTLDPLRVYFPDTPAMARDVHDLSKRHASPGTRVACQSAVSPGLLFGESLYRWTRRLSRAFSTGVSLRSVDRLLEQLT